ncbi:MAG: ferritin-like domain-containing protein [Planctomycetota bacterium]
MSTPIQTHKHTTATEKPEELQRKAEIHVEDGPVTADYEADREAVLGILDKALATELVCFLRYRRHHYMAHGLRARAAAAEFLEHSQQELDHGHRIAQRITQLGGRPDLDPSSFADRSHSDYVECRSLEEMVRENLVAERIAIATYRELIRTIGDRDPTTRRLLESVLAVEEEHADDLVNLLTD